ncbi:Poly(A)-specific ribonuclease PARN [Colletotrichum sp. SAR11_239]|nr:Poly(A)-specific ribonuclease PARN [Colletotrichum sp. SAR11_239]
MSENFWKKTNQTRQGIYETGKRIASTYNVFELGLTYDSYKTESYSFYVSPLLLEDTREDSFFAKDLGRNLTASLSTLRFMRKEGLQLEKIFDNPVPYLSRKESRDAIERLESRAQTQPIKDHPYDEDEEGLNFFSTYVFDEITSWLGDRNDDRKSEIEIRIPYSDSKKRSSVYHKIVRVTAQNLVPHMKCRTWNHGLSVIISPEDSDENQERQQTYRDNLSASIRKQTGLRLIMEALSGGHFADIIDPSYIIEALSSWPGGMTVQSFCQEVQQKFGNAPLLSPERESGFMTAVILLRLAHKLARRTLDNVDEGESWDKKMRRLYDKGWLLEIGRDPECFGSDSGSDFEESTASSDGDGEEVGELYWGHSVFDMFRNTLRIGPSTNVFLERQWAADRAFRQVPRPKSDAEGCSISS